MPEGKSTLNVHTISLDDLIIHKYADREALIGKADKVARALIEAELRPGEAFKVSHPGTYLLYLPKLTKEAGALRCSILSDQIYKAIMQVNPTSLAIAVSQPAEPVPRSAARPARDAGSRAFGRMADDKPKADEISPQHQQILDGIELVFHPVWHVRNKLITAYLCIPTFNGETVTPSRLLADKSASNAEALAAKIDAAVYGGAVKALRTLMQQRRKAVLIVPINFSTVDRLEHMRVLLGGAADITEDAKSLLVFELIDVPPDATRFRLREPVRYLRTRSRALIGRIGFNFHHHEVLKELEFHGVSVNVPSYEWDEKRLLEEFEQFAINAERFRLQSFTHGLVTTSLTIAAMASGITYMDGPVVADAVTSPDHLKPFEIDMLYAG